MKSAQISFHDSFPTTPVSYWAGARWSAWIRKEDATGHLQHLTIVRHPFAIQRKAWCLLEVHFDTVELRFATPQELDHFVGVLAKNPLQSGRSLFPDCAIGRPKGHWLAKLPSKAKSRKFRKRICIFLAECPEANEFLEFYRNKPVQVDFPGYYDTIEEARNSSFGQNEYPTTLS